MYVFVSLAVSCIWLRVFITACQMSMPRLSDSPTVNNITKHTADTFTVLLTAFGITNVKY